MLKEEIAFTSVELLKNLCKVVITLGGTMAIPDKPPLKLPGVPTLGKIGTRVQDFIEVEVCTVQDSLDVRIKDLRRKKMLETQGFVYELI